MRITFDTSGVQVVERELGDTRLGSEIFLRLDSKDAPLLDTVEISAEAREAANRKKAA